MTITDDLIRLGKVETDLSRARFLLAWFAGYCAVVARETKDPRLAEVVADTDAFLEGEAK